ncbi:hypothetical protein EDC96DRAFT_550150 [Choanephora cucurbitarum]|nr:hypothetical protein EDC96DRAFT_550150 [Choanephora cucurbitarum]
MSYFSDKIDSLLRGTRKTEDEFSEIKMHVEQLEDRFEKRINQLFTMVERNNKILKKLVVVEEVTVLPACLISRPHIKDMHGDSNTPLKRFKYFLISCFGDSINADVNISFTNRAKKEAMMKSHLTTLEQLNRVVLADLLYPVQEKEPELKVKTWTQIPLKYTLAAYDDLRNKKPDQLVKSHLTSSVYSNANLLAFQSSKSKTAEGLNPAKVKQPVEGLRAVVSGGNVPPHLAMVDLNDSELDPDLAAIISNSTVMQQGDERLLDDVESEGFNKMSIVIFRIRTTLFYNLSRLSMNSFTFENICTKTAHDTHIYSFKI